MDEARQVIEALAERRLTLAVAESYTGGLLMEALTAVPGCSDVFLGGVVAYANEVKVETLAVPRSVLRRHGAVSRETASAMAAGARKVLASDVAVATTGIAGPTGGTQGKPVGLSYVAAVADDRTLVTRRTHPGGRHDVKAAGVRQALQLLLRILGSE